VQAAVTGPLPEAGDSVDLSQLWELYRKQRRANVLFAICLGVFIGGGVGGLVFWESVAAGFNAVGVGFALVLWAAFGVGCYAAQRPGGTDLMRLVLAPKTVHLYYRNGSDTAVNFTSPSVGLTLIDFQPNLMSTKMEKQLVLFFTSENSTTRVSHEIAGQIVARARELGLSVLVQDEDFGGGKTVKRVVATRIGRPELTPGWAFRGQRGTPR